MAWLKKTWRRLTGPVKVGIICALIAILLVVIGQLRHPEDITLRSMLMGILIGGGSWGLVSWAVAYAAWDVESEIAAEEAKEAAESEAGDKSAPAQ